MGTEPGPDDPKFPALAFWILAAAGLLALAALPKEGAGQDVGMALAWIDVLLLVGLSLSWVLPRIRESKLGCLVSFCLGVAAVTAAVAGAIVLVIAIYLGTGGRR